MTEVNLIDEELKKAYKDYYPEIAKDDKLFAEIKTVGAEVFFIRLTAMLDKMTEDLSVLSKLKINKKCIEDSISHEDTPLKYPDMLTSAQDMLAIYRDVIVEADKEFTNVTQNGDMNNPEDVAKMMEVYENPLYQNATIFVSNEGNIETPQDVATFKSANMNTLNQIMDNSPEIQQMLGDMRAHANLKYAESGLTPNFSRTEQASEEHKKIAQYIDAHPKTVVALAILTEQRRAQGLQVERIENAETLAARCERSDVKALTKTLSYTAQDKNISEATRLAEKYASAEKTARDNSRTA